MSAHKGILMTALLVAFCVGIGGTTAYLTDRTPHIVNTLQPGRVPPQIAEEFDGLIKRNVRVKNEGNTDAFVRAFAVISWKDRDGDIAPEIPTENLDYSIVWADSGWEKLGDYYYCTTAVAPETMTPVLIEEVQQKAEKTGHDLVVDIVAQTIQANGTDSQGKTPVEIAWKVLIENENVHPVHETEGDSA